jgi:sterol 14-demethylase
LGNAFALLQIKTVFAILMRRFEFTSFGDPLQPDFHGVVLGPKQPCRVRYRRIPPDEAERLAAAARANSAGGTPKPGAPPSAAACPFTGRSA